MFAETLALITPWAFVFAVLVAVVAGFVKGAIGFALPLIMVSGLSLVVDPLVAIAGLILPTVVANVSQALRGGWGEARQVVRENWRYIAIVCVMIVIVAQFVTSIPTQTFYLVLGVPVMALSLVQLFGVRFRIAPRWRRASEWGVGLIAGSLGGITGTWGPPTVLYLIALEVPKAKMMVVQGVVYGLGSLSLLGGHISSGVLTLVTAPFSAALLLPTMIGMYIGARVGDRFNAEVFRRVTLIVLVVAGANLLRRGIFG